MAKFAQEAAGGSYVSVDDPHYFPGADKDGLSDALLLLYMNDNYSQAVSYHSILAGRTVSERDNMASNRGTIGNYDGCTKMMPPYLLEEWTDSMGRDHISIQSLVCPTYLPHQT
eukprot:821234-Ditylum_brightwellii.AAC.1